MIEIAMYIALTLFASCCMVGITAIAICITAIIRDDSGKKL